MKTYIELLKEHTLKGETYKIKVLASDAREYGHLEVAMTAYKKAGEFERTQTLKEKIAGVKRRFTGELLRKARELYHPSGGYTAPYLFQLYEIATDRTVTHFQEEIGELGIEPYIAEEVMKGLEQYPLPRCTHMCESLELLYASTSFRIKWERKVEKLEEEKAELAKI